MADPAGQTQASSAAEALEGARELYRAGAYAEGLEATTKALGAWPGEADLWNVHAVLLRQLKRPEEALDALDRAIALAPERFGPRLNRGNVLLDLGRAAEAEAQFRSLTVDAPEQAVVRLRLARALMALGRPEDAAPEVTAAISADPGLAAAALPLGVEIAAAHGVQAGLAFAEAVIAAAPACAWAHAYAGELLVESDAEAAERRLREACALDPSDPGAPLLLAALLSRARGSRASLELGEAQAFARRALAAGVDHPTQLRLLREVLARLWDFEGLDELDHLASLGAAWAETGETQLLLTLLPWVKNREDRLDVLRAHERLGAAAGAAAAQTPIERRTRAAGRERLRLGLLSADLRSHPVGYLLEPLFEHPDPRFELFAYDLDAGGDDPLKRMFEEGARNFRRLAGASPRAIAQAIAEDGVDILIELGGWTGANRPEALAWRPAPVQLSWLGYPHSSGVPGVDGFLCDVENAPAEAAYLLEPALILPRSWIAFGSSFAARHAAAPAATTGRPLSFGTANAAYKYTPASLRAWASIVAAAPGSRFVFIRPEAASSIFRRNVLAQFAAEGVAEDRVVFHAASGAAYLALHGEIDISLDTFPLTGGTTTLEALWMGTPVVTLKGPALFERLSASILASAGLRDLVADDLKAYREAAIGLAADTARRTALRADLRAQVRAGPLGDAAGFARDFYGLLAQAAARPHQNGAVKET